ncbi:MAG: HNH endonuclease [Elainellaceae cyanobacterium]
MPPEEASAARFEIDHSKPRFKPRFKPRSLGGLDTFENLALACQRCNSYRYNFTKGIEPESQVSTELFNPRIHQWNEHFAWEEGGLVIRGQTPIGRATCDRLTVVAIGDRSIRHKIIAQLIDSFNPQFPTLCEWA